MHSRTRWGDRAARHACALLLMAAMPCVLAAPAGPQTVTLSVAWHSVMQNDPGYQAALNERDAGLTQREIGRAGLLPQISASAGRTRIHGTLETPGACGPECTDLDYTSRINEIRATQTVFDWSRIAEYQQGKARADHSLAVFDTQVDDIALRLFNRYFQTLLAQEQAALAEEKLQANAKQVQIAERRFSGGDGTIVDIQEARSRHDLARADLIKAKDAVIVAQRELQEMLGYAPGQLATLQDGFEPQPLQPATEAEWQLMALEGNPGIHVAAQNMRVADHEIDRVFGGHLPTLELVLAYRDVDAETITTRDQSSHTTAVGVQAVLPIYAGGRVMAQVEQARHNYDRSAQELAAARSQVAVDITRHYQGVVTGAQRIGALVRAVASSTAALKATETGHRLGERTTLDVLDAEDRLFQARLDLMQARLQYVLAHLSLAAAAGRLDPVVIERVDRMYFAPGSVH